MGDARKKKKQREAKNNVGSGNTDVQRHLYRLGGVCRNSLPDVDAHHVISQKLTLPSQREPMSGRFKRHNIPKQRKQIQG